MGRYLVPKSAPGFGKAMTDKKGEVTWGAERFGDRLSPVMHMMSE